MTHTVKYPVKESARQKSLKNAIETLIREYTYTEIDPIAFFKVSETALEPIAKLLGIGLMTTELNAPPNPVLLGGEHKAETLYSSSGVINYEDSFKKKFRTDEGGEVTIKIYPYEGEYFCEDIEDVLSLIAQIVFSYAGRARLAGMVRSIMIHDTMTGLPNIKLYMQHIAKVMATGRIGYYDAYYLNTRNFKYINKIVKYNKGDEIMIQYARKLMSFAGDGEIIGRLGGDNFMALIERGRRQEFIRFFSNIELQVETDAGIRLVSLSATAGIYEIPDKLDSPSEVMLPISVAYQAAKQIYHKPYVFYNEKISQKILTGQKIIVDFSKSLENKEFVPFFQPKVIVRTGEICGAEALARWNHNGGIVPPAQFIPILEQDGTICKLDFEILRQTCICISNWLSKGIEPVRISVNFSRWNLQNQNLVKDIMAVLAQYQIDPKYIEIELTETVDSEEYPIMTYVFSELKKCGIATSIDDFGTGYSSLNLIKNLAVDVLKLDRSFISEIGNEKEGHKDRVLISNIINMAGELDMKVIAEGVETEVQRDFLLNANCDMIQGFLYAKPMPKDEFEQRLSVKRLLE